ncbi:MAG TPA: cob(I)yrinic acid a,c-diamide adenosyltransferase [Solimonas sp.]|nr:cob(I)yrinic acid a,c-diamide adenosyltransferase [Solimonas sp.]
MGNRLSKIVTRTGDTGTTGLATGGRLSKAHQRVQSMGDVDELNCHIGLLRTQSLAPALDASLQRIQHELFNLGGELAMPGHALVTEAHVEKLDEELGALNESLPPLKEFVLPGGSPATAQAHMARAVARRAERALWTLHAEEPLSPFAMQYLNRLSDYLFVIARTLARADGAGEVSWNHRR